MSEIADYIAAKIQEQLGPTYTVEAELPSGRIITVTGGVKRQVISVGLIPEQVNAPGVAGTGDPLNPYTYIILPAEDWIALAKITAWVGEVIKEQEVAE